MKPSHRRRWCDHGSAKKVGSAGDVLKRQFEKERLNRFAVPQLLADWRVIFTAVFDDMVENRGIRSDPVTDSSSM
jgi:hypothetical protein